MKAKKSNVKPSSPPADDAHREALDRARSHAQSLIYNHNLSTSRAEPSPFASLLVNDEIARSPPKAKSEGSRELRAEQKAEERLRRRKRKEALLPMHLLNPAVLKSTAFAFDVPSPDDVVINARKGTSLSAARHAIPSSKHSSQTSSDVRSRLSAASVR